MIGAASCRNLTPNADCMSLGTFKFKYLITDETFPLKRVPLITFSPKLVGIHLKTHLTPLGFLCLKRHLNERMGTLEIREVRGDGEVGRCGAAKEKF